MQFAVRYAIVLRHVSDGLRQLNDNTILVLDVAIEEPLYFLANLEPIFANVFVSAMPTDIGIPTARSTSADILEP